MCSYRWCLLTHTFRGLSTHSGAERGASRWTHTGPGKPDLTPCIGRTPVSPAAHSALWRRGREFQLHRRCIFFPPSRPVFFTVNCRHYTTLPVSFPLTQSFGIKSWVAFQWEHSIRQADSPGGVTLPAVKTAFSFSTSLITSFITAASSRWWVGAAELWGANSWKIYIFFSNECLEEDCDNVSL